MWGLTPLTRRPWRYFAGQRDPLAFPVMITAHSLTKRYGATTAVDDLTFEVQPGVVTTTPESWRSSDTSRDDQDLSVATIWSKRAQVGGHTCPGA